MKKAARRTLAAESHWQEMKLALAIRKRRRKNMALQRFPKFYLHAHVLAPQRINHTPGKLVIPKDWISDSKRSSAQKLFTTVLEILYLGVLSFFFHQFLVEIAKANGLG